MLTKSIKEADKRVKKLKTRLTKVLADPAQHDPVYQACQRIFHRDDSLVLTRDNPLKKQIRVRALRRYLHGCPPRKRTDTSYGDAFNWEWMVYCAQAETAELVIVSRDSDYGASFENQAYVNDHLKHEFGERVSKKRKLLLYTRLSDALKHFEVPISPQEEAVETELVHRTTATGLVEPSKVEVVAGPLMGVVGYVVGSDSPGRVQLKVRLGQEIMVVSVDQKDTTPY